MFGHAARAAARPAVAAAAAAVTANAIQGPAQARAPPVQTSARPAAHPQLHNKIGDDWVLAELQDEVVLFQPFDGREVEEAANTVMEIWSCRPPPPSRFTAQPIVAEPTDDEYEYEAAGSSSAGTSSSGVSSDTYGDAADAAIEAAGCSTDVVPGVGAAAAGRRREREAEWEQMETLMAITTKMLRRPGMQREVVMCMMEDVEVRELMLRQCGNLDQYLEAAGIHPNPQLLPPADSGVTSNDTAAAAAASPAAFFAAAQSAANGARGTGGGPNLMSRLAGAVAGALEKAGDALAALGGWLRRYVASAFAGAQGEEEEQEQEEGAAAAAATQAHGEADAAPEARRPPRSADQVLGGVMVLAVAVFCVAIIRRPLVLRAMARR